MKREFPSQGEPGGGPAPTTLINIVFAGDTNHHGTLFGGAGLALMDRVTFIAASRFGRVPFVTASCERVDFRKPAYRRDRRVHRKTDLGRPSIVDGRGRDDG
ncbi:hotdog domain-containing protein [Ensifer sp. BR816]|uniref:hotdog domain-containing protein n=1 Tax=Rhizobium sp. (strain BR816) TaxID=1057002 RepID=UPI00039CBCFA|nr:hotdog domain-containing protein [Ensifer sp. BR816]